MHKNTMFILVSALILSLPGGLFAGTVFDADMPSDLLHQAQSAFQKFNQSYAGKWQAEFSNMGTVKKVFGNDSESLNPNAKVAADYQALAEEFINHHRALFLMSEDISDLRVAKVMENRGGFHVIFQQNYKNVPIYRGLTYLHFNKNAQLQMIDNKYIPHFGNAMSVNPRIQATEAIDLAKASLGQKVVDRVTPQSKLVLFPSANRISLAWQVTLGLATPFTDYLIFVHAGSGKVLATQDIFFDATGQGQIWPQNPVATPDYDTRTLERLDGSGMLKGQYVDSYSSSNTRATESSMKFIYESKNPHFEEVMVYYHIDMFHEFLNDMGYSNVRNKAIPCDVHNKSIGDNAGYSPVSDSISFGGTKIDFAEDGDVVVHEYAHAIQYSLGFTGGSTSSAEGGGMHEGFGDYFAATYFNDPNLAEYASTALTPSQYALRDLENNNTYPDDMTGEVHADGEVWGPTVWDMHKALGKATSDAILLDAIGNFPDDPSFCDGYKAIQLSDKNLNRSRNEAEIKAIFVNRGIIQEDESCTPRTTPGGRCAGTVYPMSPISGLAVLLLMAGMVMLKVRFERN